MPTGAVMLTMPAGLEVPKPDVEWKITTTKHLGDGSEMSPARTCVLVIVATDTMMESTCKRPCLLILNDHINEVIPTVSNVLTDTISLEKVMMSVKENTQLLMMLTSMLVSQLSNVKNSLAENAQNWRMDTAIMPRTHLCPSGQERLS
jgi:hypothetical protein